MVMAIVSSEASFVIWRFISYKYFVNETDPVEWIAYHMVLYGLKFRSLQLVDTVTV